VVEERRIDSSFEGSDRLRPVKILITAFPGGPWLGCSPVEKKTTLDLAAL
jgi:hypothetical protein